MSDEESGFAGMPENLSDVITDGQPGLIIQCGKWLI